jgi:hypothetical protein
VIFVLSFGDGQRGEARRTPGTGARATAAVADRMYSMHGVSEHRGTLTKHAWPPSAGALR